jgi:hypothetical protein
MPGVLVNCGDCELPASVLAQDTPVPHKPDWAQLADDAAQNADLDTADFLPPPPEVITIDDEDDFPATAILLTTSHLPIIPKVEPNGIANGQSPKVESEGPPPQLTLCPSTPMPSYYPTRSLSPPQHLGKYHLFTTVADELNQSPVHPYWTAGGSDVNLAITDKNMIAQRCHYIMTHTADTLFCASDIPLKKKQCRFKAGLKLFADQGNESVIKELKQFCILECFKPCDPSTLLQNDRRNALTLLMFLTEKPSGKVKAWDGLFSCTVLPT